MRSFTGYAIFAGEIIPVEGRGFYDDQRSMGFVTLNGFTGSLIPTEPSVVWAKVRAFQITEGVLVMNSGRIFRVQVTEAELMVPAVLFKSVGAPVDLTG